MKSIFKDADVKRSAAYLAVSLAVSAAKSTVGYIQERRKRNASG